MKLIKLSDLDALDILEVDSSTGGQSIYPSIFPGMWFQREAYDPPTRTVSGDYLFTTLGFVFSSRGVDVSKSPKQLVDEKHDPRLIISDLIAAGAHPSVVAEVFKFTGLPISFLQDERVSKALVDPYIAAFHANNAKDHANALLSVILKT